MVIKLRRQNLVTVYLTLQLAAFAGLGQVLPLADSQDELLAVFSLLGIGWALLTKRLSKKEEALLLKSVLALGLVEAIGLVSGLTSGLIKGMPVAIDAFKLVKLPLVVFYVSCCLRPWEKRTIVSNLRWASKAFILVAFLGGLVNLAAEVGLSYDLRYGIRSYKFIYENPAALNEVLLVSLVVIMLGQGLRRQKGVRLWLLLYLATVAMTLRAGGIGASGILLLALRYEQQAVRLT